MQQHRHPNNFQQEIELAELSLEDMTSLGDTSAMYNGEGINVAGGLPGEDVVAQIYRYKRRRKNFVSGIVMDVVKASPHRVKPPCPYYGPCSGCQWQHIEYAHQLRLKSDAVQKELSKYSRLSRIEVSETLPSSQRFMYRNHARFTVRFGGQLGFSNRTTRRFVRIDECMLMSPHINETLACLQDKCSETTNVSIRCGINTGQLLIQPTLRHVDIELESGQKFYQEELLGRTFRIGSPSFFQVNTVQAGELVELIRRRIGLSGKELLVDAYAGVGVFAALLAPESRRVIAIEESAAAIQDAISGNSDLLNVEYMHGKTEEILGQLTEEPDVLILDPPRRGCHPEALRAVLNVRPAKLAYVSCDPASLARDLDILVSGGYSLDDVDPIDLFPQTYHVEAVATLVS